MATASILAKETPPSTLLASTPTEMEELRLTTNRKVPLLPVIPPELQAIVKRSLLSEDKVPPSRKFLSTS